MKVSLNIDSSIIETTVTIDCKELDPEVQGVLDFLNRQELDFVVGKDGDMQHIMKPSDIHYFHSTPEGVTAVTQNGSFLVKEKLYELESFLPSNQFIRLSKSVIANLYELSKFEASFNGTLAVYFKSGTKEYVSRTFVNGIKHALKMKRRDNE
ncbi:LytTR family transcriptional regulator [Sporosarcina sp. BI001-red]|uniref:LytTR family DNA-binding domain-containing protein n=1 Tax=Sporosarcina sp. BI001-red TaxID=2282866 RepID=UPI000E249B66|nr:LytTR family DNA-binding domain-containing protein [Sporosarcina sp. BI001-red]REB07107.1 LytTR family transcriptional regulator [Sporosarcina sp. BI001-red]